MNKPFLTIEEQIAHLRTSKGIVAEESDKKYLVRFGYFNLINGYKEPFVVGKDKEGNHIYRGNTKLEQLVHLKLFDENLSNHFLKYLKAVEEEVRSSFVYKFGEYHVSKQTHWSHLDAYDTTRGYSHVYKLISKIQQELEDATSAYIKHYLDNHSSIPEWIMIKCVKFSTMNDIVRDSHRPIKTAFCELYGLECKIIKKDGRVFHDFKLLHTALNWIRIVRNICAHNERLYGLTKPNSRVKTKYHKMLGGKYVTARDLQLVDAVIFLKYFLPADEYVMFINQILTLMNELKGKIDSVAFNQVKNKMGLRNTSDLTLLLKDPNLIDYLNY